MDSFKKFIGYFCGIIGSIIFIFLVLCFIGLLIDKNSIAGHFLGFLVVFILNLVIFGGPYYLFIHKPQTKDKLNISQNEASATSTVFKTIAASNPGIQKNKWVAFFLCLFLGGVGAHRFYVGKIVTGILYLCTLGGFLGIGVLIDLICILTDGFKDKNGQALDKSWIFSFDLFLLDKYFKQIIEDHDHSWKESIEKIIQNSSKKFSPKKLQKIGKQLYEHYLKNYINDLRLTPEEMNNLNEITSYFKIPETAIMKIKKRYNKQAVDRLSKVKLEDKVLSKEDKAELYQFAEALNLPAATVDMINRNNALNILRTFKEAALMDSRLTDDEETELLELTEKLGLTEDDLFGSLSEQKRMAYCRLMWDVENGNLPVIESPVILQKNEVCHFAIDAVRLETKMVTTGYSGGSRGVSIRIAKGVSYRIGAYRAQPIKQEVTFKYPGTIVITSKRLVFIAPEKGFSVPLNKIDSIEQYRDGLGFQKGSTTYLMSLEYPDLVGLIISTAAGRL